MPAALVAVVGATATGKTALAVELARALDGEIINADSRQVYRGMDVGTAKPTREEQSAARHWLIDVVEPDQPFGLATFIDLARAAMADIRSRNKRPIIAGGTGQYVWALLEEWRVPRVPPDPDLRMMLEAQAAADGPDALLPQLESLDPVSAATIDRRNVRRVIRAIEVSRATGRPFSASRTKGRAQPGTTIIGLSLPRAELYQRIDDRVDRMIAGGLVAEVQGLIGAGYGCDLPAMAGIGYRQICEHLHGGELPEAIARIKTETHRLARMQHTWFRDDDARIHWLNASTSSLVTDALGFLQQAGLPGGASGAVS